MKIRIKTRVMQGGHRIADLSVEGDSLIEGIAAFSKVIAPHLEDEKQIQIVEVLGYCTGCDRFHYDLTAVLDSFEKMNVEMTDQIREAVVGGLGGDLSAGLRRAMEHAAGGKKGMDN